MNETLLKKLAKPMLILAPVIWGSSFVVMKHSLDSFTPFYLLASDSRRRPSCWPGLLEILAGDGPELSEKRTRHRTFLFLAYAFQTFGLDRTTSGKNAFLTAVYCVIVPFLYWLIARRRPDKWNILAAFICIAGIGMVALTTRAPAGWPSIWGDMLTLAGGFFFAAHIVAVNKFAEGRDIFLITVLQFAVFAAWSWIGALVFREPFPAGLSGGAVFAMVYLVVFSSCGALLFQNIGQKYTAPATAAVLLSLEAPFAVLCSILVGEEDLNAVMVLGFALIFLAWSARDQV
jgi:drug/metabolite transporter (DMT)-like permease